MILANFSSPAPPRRSDPNLKKSHGGVWFSMAAAQLGSLQWHAAAQMHLKITQTCLVCCGLKPEGRLALFSTKLINHRKSGWSAKQQETGSHVVSGSYWVIECTVLLWDWTYPMIGTWIKGLTSGESINTDLKSQDTVTEWTVWGFL